MGAKKGQFGLRAPLVVRPPVKGGRFKDVTGQRAGMLVARRHVGFRGVYAIWEFECDCGKKLLLPSALTFSAAKHGRTNRTHCGCQTAGRYHGMSGSHEHRVWQHLKKKGILSPAWEQFSAFIRDVGSKSGRFFTRMDRTQPAGPGNGEWSDLSERNMAFFERAVKALVKHYGMTEDAAMERASLVTRARLMQYIWVAEGKCAVCGKHNPRGTNCCITCQKKHNRQRGW